MGEGDRRSQRAARCEARHRARSARPDHRSPARRGPPAGPLARRAERRPTHRRLQAIVLADVFLRRVPGEPGQGDGYEVNLYLRQEPDPPPLPPPAWPVFTRTDGARRELQDAIFAAWHEGDDSSDQGGPQDPTSVFLARLVLPATLPATGGRPVRTGGEV